MSDVKKKDIKRNEIRARTEAKIDLKLGKVEGKSIDLYNESELVNMIIKQKAFDEMTEIVNQNIKIELDRLGDMYYVRDTLKNLSLRIQYFTLESAMLLYLVLQGRWYNLWGYKTLDEYAMAELNFTPRKAQALARLYEYYGIELGDHPEIGKELCKYGWAKMSLLVGVVDETNFDKWIQLVKKPIDELRKDVMQYKLQKNAEQYFDKSESDEKIIDVKSENSENERVLNEERELGDEADKKTESSGSGVERESLVLIGDGINKEVVNVKRVFFDVTEEQFGIIEKALYIASQNVDNVNRGYLLSLICMSYLSDYTSNGKVDLNVFLQKLESVFGVKLIAVKDYQIVYGNDFVSEVVLKE